MIKGEIGTAWGRALIPTFGTIGKLEFHLGNIRLYSGNPFSISSEANNVNLEMEQVLWNLRVWASQDVLISLQMSPTKESRQLFDVVYFNIKVWPASERHRTSVPAVWRPKRVTATNRSRTSIRGWWPEKRFLFGDWIRSATEETPISWSTRADFMVGLAVWENWDYSDFSRSSVSIPLPHDGCGLWHRLK